jgi:hypothetical protein
MPIIHTSELTSWKRCRRRWAISELARITPVKRNMNFLLGSAVHAGLEEWYKHDDAELAMKAFHAYIEEDTKELRESTPWLYAEQEAEILENIDLGEQMLGGYFAQWGRESFKVGKRAGERLLEVHFETPILKPDGRPFKGYIYAGTIDGVIVDEYGYWLLEHKTTSYTNADYLRLSDQNVMYLAFAQQTWPKITPHLRGVLYNFLRKQRPTSRVKAPLFFRERIYRNQHEIDSAMEHIFYATQDMIRAAKDPDTLCYTSPTKDCSWDCSFKTICQAMNDGTDVESMIEAGFTIADKSRSEWVSDWTPRSRS